MERRIITQIGSLPYKDPTKALEYSMKFPIPFLPELTMGGERMLEYIRNPGKLLCLDGFKSRSYETVKVQCIGPETLITSGQGYSEEESLERIYLHSRAIMDGLDAEEILFFLDEPSLGHGLDYISLWKQVFEAIDIENGSKNVKPWVHTCAYANWDMLLKSFLDGISFDASICDITDTPDYKDEYRSNKRIAWGITEASQIRDFRPGDLITPTCGLGSGEYDAEDCERILRMLQDASYMI
jgi:hypothetical protein